MFPIRFRIGLLTLLVASVVAGSLIALNMRATPWIQVGKITQPIAQKAPHHSSLCDYTILRNTGLVACVWYFGYEPNISDDRLIVSCWSIQEERLLWTSGGVPGRIGGFANSDASKLTLLVLHDDSKHAYAVDLKSGKFEGIEGVEKACEHNEPQQLYDGAYAIRALGDSGKSFVAVYKKNIHLDEWWGIALFPEFWVAVAFSIALVWSMRRDRKILQGKQGAPNGDPAL